MTHAVRQTNQALREAATRLVEERDDLPPGSVLRCFSASVRAALLAGCPPTQVAAEAERLARERLEERPARRHRPRLHLVEPRVPRPRGAS